MSTALGDYRPHNRRSARQTGLAAPAVDAVALLKPPLPSRCVHIIRDRRPAAGNRLLQYLNNRRVQRQRALPRNRRGQRMYARTVQRFIHIDIPQATKEGLVQQNRFDAAAPGAQTVDKLGWRDLQRFRAEARKLEALDLKAPALTCCGTARRVCFALLRSFTLTAALSAQAVRRKPCNMPQCQETPERSTRITHARLG
mgnify:CR=1 FL=1